MLTEDADQPVRRATRLPGYDYSLAGAYFITICCSQMKTLFGTVHQASVQLNTWGRIALAEMQSIPQHHNVGLDTVIVMPNHVHAILFLDPDRFRESISVAGGPRAAPTAEVKPATNLSTVVNLYKQAVTRSIRRAAGYAEIQVWQRGYYDHIIRDEEDLLTRRRYMLDNPMRWQINSR